MLWEELSRVSQGVIQDAYEKYQGRVREHGTESFTAKGACLALEDLFGKDNLTRPRVLGWNDVEKHYPERIKHSAPLLSEISCATAYLPARTIRRLMAEVQIAEIINLGYGGEVTEPEWQADTMTKWIIIPRCDEKSLMITHTTNPNRRGSLAFRSEEEANEFLRHNSTLAEDYYGFVE